MLENVPYTMPNTIKFFLRRFFSMLTLFAPSLRGVARRSAQAGFVAYVLVAGAGLAVLSGCSHLRPRPKSEYVYVTAKQTFLRDRVAAVSNRTGTVANGDRLTVMDHGRRFYHVKTEKGEIGWIDEKAVATQQVFEEFKTLADAHKNDPPVASAVVQDEVYLHLKAGRDTERFYRLAEGEKLQLLDRATLPKPMPGGVPPRPVTPTKPANAVAGAGAAKPGDGTKPTGVANQTNGAAETAPAEAPAPVPMEDWWLVRDGKGRAGWLLSRMLEVDAPETLTRYAEGQRIIGAYVLTTVHDDEAEQENKDIPIYLTVMGPYQSGLPYDFDQVRVFTWSMKMHRYETAYREKNIEGYLPVSMKMEKDPYGKAVTAQMSLPTFRYKVLAADAGKVVPDPVTGMVTPGRLIEKTYRLEGNLVRRIQAPGSAPDDAAHPVIETKKDKKGKKK